MTNSVMLPEERKALLAICDWVEAKAGSDPLDKRALRATKALRERYKQQKINVREKAKFPF